MTDDIWGAVIMTKVWWVDGAILITSPSVKLSPCQGIAHHRGEMPSLWHQGPDPKVNNVIFACQKMIGSAQDL